MRRLYVVPMGTILILIATLFPGASVSAAPDIAAPFRDYYAEHQGWRILGAPLSDLIEIEGTTAQYFEKGRIEDHRGKVSDPAWAFMYGRLTAELMVHAPEQAVNATNITYAALESVANPNLRMPAPINFSQGTQAVQDGIFVPYDAFLRAAPGYVVPLYFWSYITQADLFPGGWLHDIGLPMSAAFLVTTVKQGEQRQIMLQAFERTVLTYDPLNPRAWQVERGNIGADMFNAPEFLASIELPAANTRVIMPMPLIARGGRPGDQMTVTLRWSDGTTLVRTYTLLRGEDGQGLLITNLDWRTESRPPQPAARAAMLELRDAAGVIQARRPVEVLRWDDPEAQPVTMYWLLDQTFHAVQYDIPRTVRVGTATLEALLWGPRPGNLAGFTTPIPTPEEVLTYAGRTTNWGPRVKLRSLTINKGIARADFSREMLAFGGDTARAAQIRTQVTQTLLQFPTVTSVYITVEGDAIPALRP